MLLTLAGYAVLAKWPRAKIVAKRDLTDEAFSPPRQERREETAADDTRLANLPGVWRDRLQRLGELDALVVYLFSATLFRSRV